MEKLKDLLDNLSQIKESESPLSKSERRKAMEKKLNKEQYQLEKEVNKAERQEVMKTLRKLNGEKFQLEIEKARISVKIYEKEKEIDAARRAGKKLFSDNRKLDE